MVLIQPINVSNLAHIGPEGGPATCPKHHPSVGEAVGGQFESCCYIKSISCSSLSHSLLQLERCMGQKYEQGSDGKKCKTNAAGSWCYERVKLDYVFPQVLKLICLS